MNRQMVGGTVGGNQICGAIKRGSRMEAALEKPLGRAYGYEPAIPKEPNCSNAR